MSWLDTICLLFGQWVPRKAFLVLLFSYFKNKYLKNLSWHGSCWTCIWIVQSILYLFSNYSPSKSPTRKLGFPGYGCFNCYHILYNSATVLDFFIYVFENNNNNKKLINLKHNIYKNMFVYIFKKTPLREFPNWLTFFFLTPPITILSLKNAQKNISMARELHIRLVHSSCSFLFCFYEILHMSYLISTDDEHLNFNSLLRLCFDLL